MADLSEKQRVWSLSCRRSGGTQRFTERGYKVIEIGKISPWPQSWDTRGTSNKGYDWLVKLKERRIHCLVCIAAQNRKSSTQT